MINNSKKRYAIRRYLSGDGFGAKMGNYAILYAIHLGTGLTPAYLKDETSVAFDFFNKEKPNKLDIDQAFPNVRKTFEAVNFKDHAWCDVNTGLMPLENIIDSVRINRALGKDPNFSFEWFQIYTQWYPFKREVANLFTFDKDLVTKAKENLPKTDKKIVGVSFRNEYKRLESGHSKLSINYYKKAFSLFPKDDSVFLVFADFIEECPEILEPISKEYEIIYTKPLSSAEGMCALSQCDHIINANSSFSFWASILNKNPNKKIVCPNYFVEPTDKAHKILNHKWFPEDWIGLDEI
jgi:hypothetical protein